MYVYIYIYRERERERESEFSIAPVLWASKSPPLCVSR